VDSFLLPLPVGRLPGVGKVTESKLKTLAIDTGRRFAKAGFARLGESLRSLRCTSIRTRAWR
jgi:nucleotidyltransferase/DNA polymerase involved in DNA repair